MSAPLTPKLTRKAEALAKAPPTIASRRKEDVALKEVAKPRLSEPNDIFETKTKDGSTAAKAPVPRTNPNTKEAPTTPKPHTHPSHECDGQVRNPGSMTVPLTPKPTRKAEALVRAPPTIVSRRKEDAALEEVAKPRLCCANGIFETKTKDGSTAAKAPAPRTILFHFAVFTPTCGYTFGSCKLNISEKAVIFTTQFHSSWCRDSEMHPPVTSTMSRKACVRLGIANRRRIWMIVGIASVCMQGRVLEARLLCAQSIGENLENRLPWVTATPTARASRTSLSGETISGSNSAPAIGQGTSQSCCMVRMTERNSLAFLAPTSLVRGPLDAFSFFGGKKKIGAKSLFGAKSQSAPPAACPRRHRESLFPVMKAQGDARVPAVDGACVNRDVMKHVASVTDYELLARLHFAARKQVKRGNLDMARNLYRTALVLTNFEFARTFLLWGLLEQRAGHIHVARTLFNLGTRIHPRNDSLHCACGLMESKLGHSRAAEARRHFMCAFKLNPQRHGPLLNWKRLGLQGGGIADQDVSRENKKDKKSRNEMPGDPEDVLVEFTTALDMNWEDWVPSVATEYRVAISAAVASTPENVRILNASYVQGVVHVLTQYTVRASIAGITYRRARAEEEVPGGVRRSFASIVELELERRNFVGAHLVRKLRSWEAGDVSASDTHTHTSAAAAARQWVTEEARRLRSEAGAGKGWIESGKTVHLLQSVLEQPIYLC